MELNKIYNADCVGESGMKILPDKSIDLILCDLPYGTTNCAWDTVIPFNLLWSQYERIIKDNGAIVFFAQSPFDKVLGASNLPLYRYEWIWEKNKATGHLNADKMPMKAHENLLVFYKKAPVYNPQMSIGHKPMNYAKNNHNSEVYGKGKQTICDVGTTKRYPRSVLQFQIVNNDDPDKVHPTQKPVELCEYMIKTYTNPGAVVLDNCSGSGSTLLAALNTDRYYIGFEKHEPYYKKSLERIDRHTTQLSLVL
ncbi:DNA-methyltransferase [Bacillus sp. B-jedd]|uniref:DNA-methyltransferase n=1 Tax=Bacillus sp. B-jedd TaxID=1476857 RepID=UPI00051568B2|nr:site-specific DNA-methyltransferase [Bacillus sp. B-jedd]CEG02211.1 DNA methylase N-4/N-6 domain-containing protein [Bacillus sp. B-jedd]CEG25985.1 DNA methylase N-4/N-6 domain-containing protein [Bacillus sp. B-jedd]CEG29585.1 DNA methylase N-4/N-6 domain-containing protein [Bacillus sp. B-jedd]